MGSTGELISKKIFELTYENKIEWTLQLCMYAFIYPTEILCGVCVIKFLLFININVNVYIVHTKADVPSYLPIIVCPNPQIESR